jgi:phosphoribosylamine--glycine ligase
MPRCQNLPLGVNDFAAITQYCLNEDIALVVVGPEAPLAAGIADYLQQKGIPVFGPSRQGAQIEASKAWAKALMLDGKIPTARSVVFQNEQGAKSYVREQGVPIVIKADGLAAGKGVTVATTVAEAEAAIAAAFGGQFGEAGKLLVIEECLVGQEASILALTDGITIRPLLPAQDHKRIGEGDTGANTGGMGVYAPAPVVTPEILARVQTEVLEPAVRVLRDRGIDYRGVLYAGLMITPEGNPKVIEFNCRFGDPETQAILPLLDSPLDQLLLACAQQRLGEMPPLKWKAGAAACVVAAAEGYPGDYRKGLSITGIASAESEGAIVFHAGTCLEQGHLLTDGGRVLGVTATGDTFNAAFEKAYGAIAQIQFEGIYYRRDIGYRVRS